MAIFKHILATALLVASTMTQPSTAAPFTPSSTTSIQTTNGRPLPVAIMSDGSNTTASSSNTTSLDPLGIQAANPPDGFPNSQMIAFCKVHWKLFYETVIIYGKDWERDIVKTRGDILRAEVDHCGVVTHWWYRRNEDNTVWDFHVQFDMPVFIYKCIEKAIYRAGGPHTHC